MDVGFDVARRRGEFFVGANLFFGAFAVAENTLRSFLIIPERGVSDAGFERLQAFAVQRSVKDSSERG
jgi:hypothetical protein